MPDRIGQQLGNYRLTRLLGQGGFAEVYLGEHMLLKTTIAIKILQTQVAPEDIAQFQQEAQILASLKHPHIVRILDFGIEEGTPYLMMDYAARGTLRARHPKGTVLPVATVVKYVNQAAQALQYAHERKIVHRDIKPENMLIGEQDEILLSDFGIALITQSSHYQNATKMAGTIAYMAPEQIAGRPHVASDQYALGIIAYEWLCGTRPFHGTFTEIAVQHSLTPPISPREHLPTLSLDIEHVVLIALAKRPEDRFASVRAFANAFEQACQSNIPTEQRTRMIPLSSPLFPPLPKTTGPPEIQTTPVLSTTPIVQTAPDLPMPEKMAGKPALSRRVVLMGTASGVAVAAMGISAFVILRTQPPQTHPQQQPTRQPTLGQLLSTYKGHTDAVAMAVWSPDEQRIVSSSSDKTVQVWNANDGSTAFIYLGHSGATRAVAWELSGQRIASGSEDKTVQVWNANDGSHAFTYPGHTDKVWGVTWEPNRQRIASCSDDKTVQVWNANDGSHAFTYPGHTNAVWAVAWSPNGQLIASGSLDKTVQVWNANDGSIVFTGRGHTNGVRAVVWSPDGKLIASGSWDGTVQVWNASDGSNVFTYRGHTNQVKTVAWSPDGKLIASGAADKTVRVWSASNGSEVFIYKGHSDTVSTVAWSPDGKRIASGSWDKTMQVWYVG